MKPLPPVYLACALKQVLLSQSEAQPGCPKPPGLRVKSGTLESVLRTQRPRKSCVVMAKPLLPTHTSNLSKLALKEIVSHYKGRCQ